MFFRALYQKLFGQITQFGPSDMNGLMMMLWPYEEIEVITCEVKNENTLKFQIFKFYYNKRILYQLDEELFD